MRLKEALIVGSDCDSCSLIREFLETNGLNSTVVLNYKDGLEKLLYEKPDIAVLELVHTGVSSTLISKINNSGQYEILDFENGTAGKVLKPVLILEEHEKIPLMLDFLKSYLEESESDSSEPEQEGDLGDVPYLNLLMSLHRDRRTGVLTVNSRVRLEVYFINGVPVFAEGGDIKTALGRMLLDSGRIQRPDYEAALDAVVKKGQMIGRVLVEMGVISPHELSSFLGLQVKEKIIRGFGYAEGAFSFKPASDFTENIVSYPIKLSQILHEGIKRYIGAKYIESILLKEDGNGDIEVVSPDSLGLFSGTAQEDIKAGLPELHADLKGEVNSAGLSPRELRFVQLLKDGAGIMDTVASSALGRDEALKTLFFLYLIGYIRVSGVKDFLTLKNGLALPYAVRLLETEYEKDDAVRIGPRDSLLTHLPDAQPEREEWEISSEKVSDEGRVSPISEAARLDEEDVINLEEEIMETAEFDTSEEEVRVSSAESENEIGTRAREERVEQEIIQIMDRVKKKMNKDKESQPSETEARDGGRDNGKNGKKRTREERDALTGEILKLYSTLDEMDYYRILGVTKDSTKNEVKNAYFNLVKKYHPDANSDLSKDMRHKSEEIFVKIAQAHETLSDDRKRAYYDTQLETSDIRLKIEDLYEAELAYKKGKLLIKRRNYHEAETEFKRAVALNPEEAVYLGALAWVAFLAAEDKDKVFADVKKRLESAIALNPEVAEIYYYLGCVYRQTNLKSDAEANFTKALEYDSDFLEAKRELWLLEKRKPERDDEAAEKNRKGFWSNLFGK